MSKPGEPVTIYLETINASATAGRVHTKTEQLHDSLYATIRECSGSSPQEAVEIYEAVTLNKRDAELLHMRAGEAAFRIQRISKNTSGEIFEYCVELARGDSNKFQIVLKNSGVQYSRVL